MLLEPVKFSTAVQGLLLAQKEAISVGSVAGGEHLCFVGNCVKLSFNFIQSCASVTYLMYVYILNIPINVSFQVQGGRKKTSTFTWLSLVSSKGTQCELACFLVVTSLFMN